MRARTTPGIICAVLLLAGGCRPPEMFAVEPRQPAPALETTRATGDAFRLSDLRGKVVVLSFGYTACPDVCPTTLTQLRRLQERLGEAHEDDVEMLFVSVDPQRDSAEGLEEYAHAFHPRITGLRLAPEALAQVLSDWNVTVTRRYLDNARYREHPSTQDVPYSIDHTGAFFLVDKRGVLRLRIPFSVGLERLREEVVHLLEEESGPRVEKAHARLTPARVGAVYLTLVNGGSGEDRLLSAESPQAERVELHEVIPEGEFLRMQPRPEGFVLPARGRVELTPGGKHLMLYSTAAAAPHLALTLRFEKAGTLSLSVPVSGPGADAP